MPSESWTDGFPRYRGTGSSELPPATGDDGQCRLGDSLPLSGTVSRRAGGRDGKGLSWGGMAACSPRSTTFLMAVATAAFAAAVKILVGTVGLAATRSGLA